MRPTRQWYRLDYFGDDVPEYLSESDTALVLECSYQTRAVVEPLLTVLRQGRRVHVRPGVLRLCGSSLCSRCRIG